MIGNLQTVGFIGHPSEPPMTVDAERQVIELCRYRTQFTETSASGGLAGWRLRLIDERLQEMGKIPTLNELASLCHISVRQLSRGFRASRGCSIGTHVANIQLDHAKRLLTTDQRVKAIAYSLGFSSPPRFCYAFRRSTGETPGQFRQRLAERGRDILA